MADTYIDQSEAIRYNQHTVGSLPALGGLSPEVGNIIKTLTELDASIGGTLQTAGDTRSTARLTGDQLRELSDLVATRLGRLLDKLKDQKKDGATFDLARFFEPANRESIGRSVADRSAALTRALGGLQQYKAEVKDAQAWIDELSPMSEQMQQAVKDQGSTSTAKLEGTRDLNGALDSWRRQYGAAKYIVRGLLRRVGREDEWKDHFLDLKAS